MDADGTLAASSGVDTGPATGGGNGFYQVTFGRDVSNCAAVATARTTLGATIVPTIPVVARNSPTQVSVVTFKYDGTVNASAFELAVFC